MYKTFVKNICEKHCAYLESITLEALKAHACQRVSLKRKLPATLPVSTENIFPLFFFFLGFW